MSPYLWVAAAVLGGAGACARFLLDRSVSSAVGGRLPLGTMAVNLSGAFLLGLVVGVEGGKDWELLAGTALLGAFTTFSTWFFESHRLAEQGNLWPAVLNLVISLLLGLGLFKVGRLLGGMV